MCGPRGWPSRHRVRARFRTCLMRTANPREVQCVSTGRACVLDVVDRDRSEAEGIGDHLPADALLAGDQSPRGSWRRRSHRCHRRRRRRRRGSPPPLATEVLHAAFEPTAEARQCPCPRTNTSFMLHLRGSWRRSRGAVTAGPRRHRHRRRGSGRSRSRRRRWPGTRRRRRPPRAYLDAPSVPHQVPRPGGVVVASELSTHHR